MNTLRFFLLSFIIFSASLQAFSQKEILERVISIEASDETFEEIIDKIKHKDSISFSYNSDLLGKKRYSFHFQSKTIQEIIAYILTDTGLDFTQIGDQVVIFPKKKNIIVTKDTITQSPPQKLPSINQQKKALTINKNDAVNSKDTIIIIKRDTIKELIRDTITKLHFDTVTLTKYIQQEPSNQSSLFFSLNAGYINPNISIYNNVYSDKETTQPSIYIGGKCGIQWENISLSYGAGYSSSTTSLAYNDFNYHFDTLTTESWTEGTNLIANYYRYFDKEDSEGNIIKDSVLVEIYSTAPQLIKETEIKKDSTPYQYNGSYKTHLLHIPFGIKYHTKIKKRFYIGVASLFNLSLVLSQKGTYINNSENSFKTESIKNSSPLHPILLSLHLSPELGITKNNFLFTISPQFGKTYSFHQNTDNKGIRSFSQYGIYANVYFFLKK